MKSQIGEKAVKVRSMARRILVVTGLVVASFVSTSYAQSGKVCFSSYAELKSRPEAGRECSVEKLKGIVGNLKQGVWSAGGATVKFVDPQGDSFYVIYNGAKKYGRLCCSGGRWSSDILGPISMNGNELRIGAMFLTRQRESNNRSSSVQFAELPNAGSGVN